MGNIRVDLSRTHFIDGSRGIGVRTIGVVYGGGGGDEGLVLPPLEISLGG